MMSDLIRREDAREAIEKLMEIYFDRKVALAKARDAIVSLPSAEAVEEAVPTVVRVTMSDGNQYYLEHERDECDHCVYKWGTKGGDDE